MFAFLPYHVDVPMQRLPIANWVIIAATSLVSIAVWAAPDAAKSLMLSRTEFNAYQLLSYMVVHAGLSHLLGNMFGLFLFGNAINSKLGHWQFVLLYLLLGVVAGAAWLLIGQGEALAGASGAIMGITGVFLVFYPRNEVQVFYWIIYRAGTFTLSSGWLILLYMLYDVWGTVFDDGVVAYACHLGGWILGGGIAVLLLQSKLVKTTMDEENLLQVFGLQKRIKRHQHIDSYGRRIGPAVVEEED